MSDRTRAATLLTAAIPCILLGGPAARAGEPGAFRARPAVAETTGALDPGVEAVSLASADFDGDGVPDAVAGFAGGGGGILRVSRGNADALYPNAPEAAQRRAERISSDAPFFTTHDELALPERPDFLLAGDFDADGREDLIAASRGSMTLWFLAGNGRGGFAAPAQVALPAPLTSLACGEIGRPDGLPDLIAAVGESDSAALVFQGPAGAARAMPWRVPISGRISGVAAGDIDEDGYGDVVMATDTELLSVSGRSRAPRLAAVRALLDEPAAAIAVGRFGGEGRPRIRLAGPSGLRLLDREPAEGGGGEAWKSADVERPKGARLAPAARLAADEAGVPELELSRFDAAAAIAMRVGPHAAKGLLTLRSNGALSVLAPAAGATMVVNTSDMTNLRDDVLTLKEAVFLANGTLAYDTLTAGEKAQVSGTPATPGFDAIVFDIPGSGVPVLLEAVPQATEPISIDGTTQAGGFVQITPPGSSSAPVVSLKGGSSLVRGLVLGGNGSGGILVDSSDNVIEGNRIGIDPSGNTAAGTISVAGVRVQSGTGNRIGGTTAAARNVISGIQGYGIYAYGGSGLSILGNFIGTNAAGTAAVANTSYGIVISAPANGTTIGGASAGGRNLVSGNNGDGIRIDTTGNVVAGNRVGTDVTGTLPIPNKSSGIHSYFNIGPNTIGGTTAGAGNLVSGNTQDGIQLDNNTTADIVVQGNRVGTNATGTAAVPNGANGIHLIGISGTTIGGAGAAARNLVSGNDAEGIFFDRFVNIMSQENVVRGNFIGTDATGTLPIPNVANGINLTYAEGNVIGGAAAGEGNVISGNNANGILISRLSPVAHPDVIRGNLIGSNVFGTGPLGNQGAGVFFHTNTSGHTVGGETASEQNTIAFNVGAGMASDYSLGLHPAPNRIFRNGGLGLDLLDDGVTPNGSGRQDNFPVLTGATAAASGTTVTGTLSSAASKTFDLYFYSNAACDASGYGEGEAYVGKTSVTTNASGQATFSKLITPTVPGGRYITAYAVLPAGAYPDVTSEFSFCRQVTGSPAPPASVPLSLAVVAPSSAGNTAQATLRISGAGIRDGATAKLTRAGSPDLDAFFPLADPAGGSLRATFDLAGVAPGSWNVVVTNPDATTATLAAAFEVRAGTGPRIWAQVVGPKKFRVLRKATFHLVYGNRGDADAIATPIWLAGIPGDVTIEIVTEIPPPPDVPGIPHRDLSLVQRVITADDGTQILPLFLPIVFPGESRVFTFTLTVPASQSFDLVVGMQQPMFGGTQAQAVTLAADDRDDGPITDGAGKVVQDPTPYWLNCAKDFIGLIPGLGAITDCVMGGVNYFANLANVAMSGSLTTFGGMLSMAEAMYNFVAACLPLAFPEAELFRDIVTLVRQVFGGGQALRDCSNAIALTMHLDAVTSTDPNFKAGPPGAGAARYVHPADPAAYAVFFQNVETATAPAQTVVVTDQLDPAVFDLASFAFGPTVVGAKDTEAPPAGVSSYTRDLDLRPDVDAIVRVTGEVDRTTGLARWTFHSLDPATGQEETDPAGGFLPPDTNPPKGEGAVLFFVRPKESLASGATFSNSASIVFDQNPAIVTPTWTNTVDKTPPTSHVVSAVPKSCANFEVTWTGSDAHSGIRDYTLYVSGNGGAYVPYILRTTQTSLTFPGHAGSTYDFYTVASDAAGNEEPPPSAPDVTATAPAGGQCFYSVVPCRLMDTRWIAGGNGGPFLQPSSLDRSFEIATRCRIPDSARAVSANVTVTGATAPGHLRLYPSGTSRPAISTINYRAGQTRANSVVLPLGEGGKLDVFCGQATGSVHLIVDVNGYFQ